jgi:hypothetical protein
MKGCIQESLVKNKQEKTCYMKRYHELYEQAKQDRFSAKYLELIYCNGEGTESLLCELADGLAMYPEELLRLYEKWQNKQPYRECLIKGLGIDQIKGKEYLFDKLLERLNK